MIASTFSVAVELSAIGFLTATAPIVVALLRLGERRRALYVVMVATGIAIGFVASFALARVP